MSLPTLGDPVFIIRFECDGRPGHVLVDATGRATPADDARMMDVTLGHGSRTGTWRVRVKPSVSVTITGVMAALKANIREMEAVYNNGYQSWTDSKEHPPFDTMIGLTNVPPRIVKQYTLDGAGDYRFTKYRVGLGEMHGFGYCYLKGDGQVALIASLSENTGYTTTRTSMRRGEVTLEKEPPARPLEAGESYELMSFAVIFGELGACIDRWFALAGIKRRPAPRIVGYSSWYRHYGDITEEKMLHDLEGCARVLGESDLGNCTGVFQIDDGWCAVGDWTRIREERFPSGMAEMAARISEKGLTPGLWLAPFMCERESNLYKEHPEWRVTDKDGEAIESNLNWSGAAAMDTRNPEYRAYVREFLRTVTEDWGFKLLKLDFLFAACMEPHDGLNRGQLIADALDLIRESVGEDIWLDLCGVPMVPAFGRCEYCRIGCDVGLDWDDERHMRLLHRERISTKWSLVNTVGRAHLNGRAFLNDPDVYFLRDDVDFTPERKRQLLAADVRCGGALLTSDDMGEWDESKLAEFRDALAIFIREG